MKQDQAAGELINGINKPVIENELKLDSDTTAHSSKENDSKGGHAQTFTGTLNNCTINIMYKLLSSFGAANSDCSVTKFK